MRRAALRDTVADRTHLRPRAPALRAARLAGNASSRRATLDACPRSFSRTTAHAGACSPCWRLPGRGGTRSPELSS